MRMFALLIILALAGCQLPPPKGASLLSAAAAPDTVMRSTDDTWNAAIRALGEAGFTIDRSDRPGGVMSTTWVRLVNLPEARSYMDCGKDPLGVQMQPGGNLTPWARAQVTVQAQTDQVTLVSVRPEFHLWLGFNSPIDGDPTRNRVAECSTTGRFEHALVARLGPGGR
jgi:hypothetical protein